jgi:rubrerythrin
VSRSTIGASTGQLREVKVGIVNIIGVNKAVIGGTTMALVMAKNQRSAKETTLILELLNKILKLEYSLIIYYPRIAAFIKDEQVRQEALQLGSASVLHADTVAKAIAKLGGTPQWAFEPFPDEADLRKIFMDQLEKEKLAYELHRQSSELAPDASFRDTFSKLAREEQAHIQTVKNILAKLP